MEPDPTIVGSRVLANLEAGRRRGIEQRRQRAAELRELVHRAARLDRATGKSEWGRASRVARRLQRDGVSITDRWVRKILGTDGPTVPHSELPK